MKKFLGDHKRKKGIQGLGKEKEHHCYGGGERVNRKNLSPELKKILLIEE
jgi:hypothetical protein